MYSTTMTGSATGGFHRRESFAVPSTVCGLTIPSSDSPAVCMGTAARIGGSCPDSLMDGEEFAKMREATRLAQKPPADGSMNNMGPSDDPVFDLTVDLISPEVALRMAAQVGEWRSRAEVKAGLGGKRRGDDRLEL